MAEKLPGRKWKLRPAFLRPAGTDIISVADGADLSRPDDLAILIGWASTLEIRQTASPRVSPKSAPPPPMPRRRPERATSAATSRASIFWLDAARLAPPPGCSSPAPGRVPPGLSQHLDHRQRSSPAAFLAGDQVQTPPRPHSRLGSVRISAQGLFRGSTRTGMDRLSACFTTESVRPSIHSVPRHHGGQFDDHSNQTGA
jgi:hypothetical protein